MTLDASEIRKQQMKNDTYDDYWDRAMDNAHDHEADAAAAAAAGFCLDVDAPFKSIDAEMFYLGYAIHLDKFGVAKADERHDMLWKNAYKKLQTQDFHELMQRVWLLDSTRWLEDLETKMIEERLRRDSEGSC
jgi:hypothetical protein